MLGLVDQHGVQLAPTMLALWLFVAIVVAAATPPDDADGGGFDA